MTKQKKATIITIICSAIILAVIIAMVSIVLVKNKSNKINLTNNNKYYIVTANPNGVKKNPEKPTIIDSVYDGVEVTVTNRETNKVYTATKVKFAKVKKVKMAAIITYGELNGINIGYVTIHCNIEYIFIDYPNNPKNNVLLINCEYLG